MYKNMSQKNLKQYLRETINSIGFCSSIKKYYPEKWDLFIFLFERHPNYPEKFYNLKDVKIDFNPVFKNQLETVIVKEDGEEDNVSIMKSCVTGKPKDNLTVAMRNAILSQILDFKHSNKLVCEICNSTKNIHIDHEKPKFFELRDEFLEKWEGEKPKNFTNNKSNSKIFKKTDIDFEKKWFSFHKQKAKLRVLCQVCNCTLK